MRYQQPTFTVPVASPRVTQEQYEVAVGLRCPKCLGVWATTESHKCPYSIYWPNQSQEPQ